MSETNVKEKDTEKSVNNIYNSFKDNISGVKLYFNKFGGLAETEDEEEIKKSSEFIEIWKKELGLDASNIESEQEEIDIPREKLIEFAKKLFKQPKISLKSFDILSKSSFLMLNNYFEYLLADLLTYYYSKYKKSLSSKEFKVSLKELEEYENIFELSDSLIIKEVESMLVEMTFDDLLLHFEKTLEIDLNEGIIDWSLIKECRERRHIIVHNSSKINKKYLTRTNNPDKLNVGNRVHISKEYFFKALYEFKLAGLLLTFNCWGKWDKEKTNEAIYSMLNESFENLQEGEYEFVDRFTCYLKKIEQRDEKQEDYLLRAKFNRGVALKKLNKKPELNNLLKEIKVGTASPIFQLAHAILADKSSEIIKRLIKKSFALEEINIDYYTEWPIFEFLHNNKDLNKEIIDILKPQT